MTLEKEKQYRVEKMKVELTKNNDEYLSFSLFDETDETELAHCKIWNQNMDRLKQFIKNGNVISGVMGEYNPTFKNYSINQIQALVSEGILGLTEDQAAELFVKVQNTIVAADLDLSAFILNNAEAITTCPAASHHHHAYVGGLLQHTCEVIDNAERLCDATFGMTEDRKKNILAACAVHDLFKVFEYSINKETGDIEYNPEFNDTCISHTAAMFALIQPQNQEIANLVACHHGQLDWGSMKPFDKLKLDEYIVFFADMMSARGGKIITKHLKA